MHHTLLGCDVCGRGMDIVKTLEDCRFINGVDCWEFGGRPRTCPMCKDKVLERLQMAQIPLSEAEEPEIRT